MAISEAANLDTPELRWLYAMMCAVPAYNRPSPRHYWGDECPAALADGAALPQPRLKSEKEREGINYVRERVANEEPSGCGCRKCGVATLLNARKTSRGQWQSPCPAHNDLGEHLSIGAAKDDLLLMKCVEGCTFGQVIHVLNAIKATVEEGSPC